MAASHLMPSAPPPSGRYLAFTDREQIALWRAQEHGVREIARRLARALSTISRELRRNAATRAGGFEYRATTAQWHADRAARRPKPAKLAVSATLRGYVQERLAGVVIAPSGAMIRSLWCRGRGAGTGGGSIGGGAGRGAPSRLPGASRATSPTMSPCASATRPSTKRCMCRGADSALVATLSVSRELWPTRDLSATIGAAMSTTGMRGDR
jgi:hypothetical protein